MAASKQYSPASAGLTHAYPNKLSSGSGQSCMNGMQVPPLSSAFHIVQINLSTLWNSKVSAFQRFGMVASTVHAVQVHAVQVHFKPHTLHHMLSLIPRLYPKGDGLVTLG